MENALLKQVRRAIAAIPPHGILRARRTPVLPNRRIFYLLAAIALIAGGCAGSAPSLAATQASDEPAPAPTVTPLSPEATQTSDVPNPAPTATLTAEQRNPAPVPSEDGPTPLGSYFGPLEPGLYTTDKMEVPLVIDVPPGWSIAHQSLWFMAFAAPDSARPGDHGVVLAVPTSFGVSDVEPSGSIGESFSAWLDEAPDTVVVGEINEVTLASRQARAVDLAVADDSECIDGDELRCILVYKAGAFGKWLSTETAFRAFWFVDETPVVIIMATPADDASWLDFAEELVRNMTFGDA